MGLMHFESNYTIGANRQYGLLHCPTACFAQDRSCVRICNLFLEASRVGLSRPHSLGIQQIIQLMEESKTGFVWANSPKTYRRKKISWEWRANWRRWIRACLQEAALLTVGPKDPEAIKRFHVCNECANMAARWE
jgi:hypothetical protein